MTAVRHLGFLNYGNFNGKSDEEGPDASHAKFRQNRSNGCGDMVIFRFIMMAAVRLDMHVWAIYREYVEVFIIVQNLVGIHGVVFIL